MDTPTARQHTEDEAVRSLVAVAHARRLLPEPAAARRIRLAARVTLDEVARVVGVTKSTVSRYEHGLRMPTDEHAAAWRTALEQLAQITGLVALLPEAEVSRRGAAG
ncbi:MAG TPA: helix-turn-helix transcriptional regulator [Gaiellaceae bacterium]|nr:helix-turn-helix transcriptional regulator [Gaiellaceae bacterium]